MNIVEITKSRKSCTYILMEVMRDHVRNALQTKKKGFNTSEISRCVLCKLYKYNGCW